MAAEPGRPQTPTEPDRSALYRATAVASMVDVGEMNFLMIDGSGDPNTSADFQTAVAALYALSYSLKFALARSGGPKVKVGPLEGLWWAPDLAVFGTAEKSRWQWTMMISQPAAVTEELFRTVASELRRTKKLEAIAEIRLEPFAEGLAAQILHVGPYSTEEATIATLHAFIAEQGLHFDGRYQKHHEIYLSDPRRAAPDKLRTIVRQPVVRR
jgi:hypothetical protein